MGSSSGIKPQHSPINLLGKLCFPRQVPWQQRKKILVVLWTLVVGVVVGGLVIAVSLLQNQRH